MMKKIIAVIILIILIASITTSYFWFYKITNKIFIPHQKDKSAATNSIQQYFDDKTPFSFVLLGYGGGNHDGAYLTDSIMVVTINPKAQKVFLISIPRDIWVKIPTNGSDGSYWKINAAYELGLDNGTYPNKQDQFKGQDGGGRLAEYVVSQVTGLPIPYFVGMDFSGFKHTIDTLGGVDIIVNPAFTDPAYPIDGKEIDPCGKTDTQIASLSAQIATGSATESDSFPCRFETLHFDAGLQHMDGAKSLSYVRSRHSLTDGTDFGRARRQRNLLVSVKEKVFSVGFIPQVIPFMTSLGDDFRTDMTLNDVKTLITNANALNKYPIETLALTDKNYLIQTFSSDKQAILESKDGLDNWTSVHNWIADELNGKVHPVSSLVLVQNGSGVSGLAQIAVNKLKNAHIQTLDPITAQDQNRQTTTMIIYDKSIDKKEVAILKKEFGVETISFSDSSQSGYNVLVILGQDYNQKQIKIQ